MKRSFLLILIVAMFAITLAGCGSKTNTDTNEEEINTEVEGNEEEVTEIPEAETTPVEENTEVSESEISTENPAEVLENAEVEYIERDENAFVYKDRYLFTHVGYAGDYFDYYSYSQEEGFGRYCVHFVNPLDYRYPNVVGLNFILEGYEDELIFPMIESYGFYGNNRVGMDLDRYNADNIDITDAYLWVWDYEIVNEEDVLRNRDKDTIVNSMAEVSTCNCNYTSGDYYEFTDGETEARVIFKITGSVRSDIMGDEGYYIENYEAMTGYACYIENYETMTGYAMGYLQRNEIFDESRVLEVVKSFDFWDGYIPE